MGRPNLFIVGAPKCGTTALSEYLRTHPQVFLSTPKELFYFCSDLPGMQRPRSDEEYLRLFASAPSSASVIAEATTLYMTSGVALPAIRRFASEAKIIAMLRDPVDIAYAFHSEQLAGLAEDEPDFERAWRLQAERSEGRSIPRFCREPGLLQYRKIASIGSQLERLLGSFPPIQVKILWFDDLRRDPLALYREALSFLELPDDGRKEFPVVNENRELRLGRHSRFMRPPAAVSRMIWRAKQVLGLEDVSLLGLVRRWNAKPTPRPALSEALRRRIALELEEEVKLVERLTGRDLSAWRSAGEKIAASDGVLSNRPPSFSQSAGSGRR